MSHVTTTTTATTTTSTTHTHTHSYSTPHSSDPASSAAHSRQSSNQSYHSHQPSHSRTRSSRGNGHGLLNNTSSAAAAANMEEAENPLEWGIDEEDGIDFKKRIADLTRRAHTDHDGNPIDLLSSTHFEEELRLDDDEFGFDDGGGGGGGGEQKNNTTTSSSLLSDDGLLFESSLESAEQFSERTKQFSTVVCLHLDASTLQAPMQQLQLTSSNNNNGNNNNKPMVVVDTESKSSSSASSAAASPTTSSASANRPHQHHSSSTASTVIAFSPSSATSTSTTSSIPELLESRPNSLSSVGEHTTTNNHLNTAIAQHSSNSSLSSSPFIVSPPTPIPNVRPGTASSSSAASTAAHLNISSSAASAAALASSNNSSGAGLGRNNSLDSSARALGLNIVYVERLALPLLRTEIYSFFRKLVLRIDVILWGLQIHPLHTFRIMLAGMEHNALHSSEDTLKKNFLSSARQIREQMEEIMAVEAKIKEVAPTAFPTINSSAAATSSSSSSTSSSPFSSPPHASLSTSPPAPPLPHGMTTISSLLPPPSALSPTSASSRSHSSSTSSPSPSPSPSPPTSSASGSASGLAVPAIPFSVLPPPLSPFLQSAWPASLQSSYAQLLKARELFMIITIGFDDANATGAASSSSSSSSSSSPTSSSSTASASSSSASTNSHASSAAAATAAAKLQANATAAAAAAATAASSSLPSSSSTSSAAATPPALPSSSSSSISTVRTHSSKSSLPHYPRLLALPTTNSNRDGLQFLARLLNSFSLLVAYEGGGPTHASRLAVAFQRLGYTLLEKHHVQEPKWTDKS